MKRQPAASSPQPRNADEPALASLEQLLGFDPTLESRPRSKLRTTPQQVASGYTSSAEKSREKTVTTAREKTISTEQKRSAADADAHKDATSKAMHPPRALASWMTAPRQPVAATPNIDLPAMSSTCTGAASEVPSSKWYTASSVKALPAKLLQPSLSAAPQLTAVQHQSNAGQEMLRKGTAGDDGVLCKESASKSMYQKAVIEVRLDCSNAKPPCTIQISLSKMLATDSTTSQA